MRPVTAIGRWTITARVSSPITAEEWEGEDEGVWSLAAETPRALPTSGYVFPCTVALVLYCLVCGVIGIWSGGGGRGQKLITGIDISSGKKV